MFWAANPEVTLQRAAACDLLAEGALEGALEGACYGDDSGHAYSCYPEPIALLRANTQWGTLRVHLPFNGHAGVSVYHSLHILVF